MAARGRCRTCGKTVYTSYRTADHVRMRANRRNRNDDGAGSVYWCGQAGGYHVSSWSRGDLDRATQRRKARSAGIEASSLVGVAEVPAREVGSARRSQLHRSKR